VIDYKAFSVYCATCHSWTGERTPDVADMRVYTPRHATIGTCDSPTGHWRGRLKPGESNCKHWIRWHEVREELGPPPAKRIPLFDDSPPPVDDPPPAP
jgi:hypothetical protein